MIIWETRHQIKEVERLRQRVPIDPPGGVDILPQLNQDITQLLSSLVTRSVSEPRAAAGDPGQSEVTAPPPVTQVSQRSPRRSGHKVSGFCAATGPSVYISILLFLSSLSPLFIHKSAVFPLQPAAKLVGSLLLAEDLV